MPTCDHVPNLGSSIVTVSSSSSQPLQDASLLTASITKTDAPVSSHRLSHSESPLTATTTSSSPRTRSALSARPSEDATLLDRASSSRAEVVVGDVLTSRSEGGSHEQEKAIAQSASSRAPTVASLFNSRSAFPPSLITHSNIWVNDAQSDSSEESGSDSSTKSNDKPLLDGLFKSKKANGQTAMVPVSGLLSSGVAETFFGSGVGTAAGKALCSQLTADWPSISEEQSGTHKDGSSKSIVSASRAVELSDSLLAALRDEVSEGSTLQADGTPVSKLKEAQEEGQSPNVTNESDSVILFSETVPIQLMVSTVNTNVTWAGENQTDTLDSQPPKEEKVTSPLRKKTLSEPSLSKGSSTDTSAKVKPQESNQEKSQPTEPEAKKVDLEPFTVPISADQIKPNSADAPVSIPRSGPLVSETPSASLERETSYELVYVDHTLGGPADGRISVRHRPPKVEERLFKRASKEHQYLTVEKQASFEARSAQQASAQYVRCESPVVDARSPLVFHLQTDVLKERSSSRHDRHPSLTHHTTAHKNSDPQQQSDHTPLRDAFGSPDPQQPSGSRHPVEPYRPPDPLHPSPGQSLPKTDPNMTKQDRNAFLPGQLRGGPRDTSLQSGQPSQISIHVAPVFHGNHLVNKRNSSRRSTSKKRHHHHHSSTKSKKIGKKSREGHRSYRHSESRKRKISLSQNISVPSPLTPGHPMGHYFSYMAPCFCTICSSATGPFCQAACFPACCDLVCCNFQGSGCHGCCCHSCRDQGHHKHRHRRRHESHETRSRGETRRRRHSKRDGAESPVEPRRRRGRHSRRDGSSRRRRDGSSRRRRDGSSKGYEDDVSEERREESSREPERSNRFRTHSDKAAPNTIRVSSASPVNLSIDTHDLRTGRPDSSSQKKHVNGMNPHPLSPLVHTERDAEQAPPTDHVFRNELAVERSKDDEVGCPKVLEKQDSHRSSEKMAYNTTTKFMLKPLRHSAEKSKTVVINQSEDPSVLLPSPLITRLPSPRPPMTTTIINTPDIQQGTSTFHKPSRTLLQSQTSMQRMVSPEPISTTTQVHRYTGGSPVNYLPRRLGTDGCDSGIESQHLSRASLGVQDSSAAAFEYEAIQDALPRFGLLRNPLVSASMNEGISRPVITTATFESMPRLVQTYKTSTNYSHPPVVQSGGRGRASSTAISEAIDWDTVTTTAPAFPSRPLSEPLETVSRSISTPAVQPVQGSPLHGQAQVTASRTYRLNPPVIHTTSHRPSYPKAQEQRVHAGGFGDEFEITVTSTTNVASAKKGQEETTQAS